MEAEFEMRGPRIAITGATGFVGRALLCELDNTRVTALCRGGADRGRGISEQVRWISGDLNDRTACETMLRDADVVIHLAGLTCAQSREAFMAVNADAAGRLAQQAAQAGVRHFILMSSLAATRPAISDYAASKAAGEEAVRAAAGRMPVTIIRAPAVLGPGDDATAPLFRMLARGLATAPGGVARHSRFSVIDVRDLARFTAELARADAGATDMVAPYSIREVRFDNLTDTTTAITGRTVRTLPIPLPLMVAAGRLADLRGRITGRPGVFGSDKVDEIWSGDWIADTRVPSPTSLDATLRSCLAPFVRAKPATKPCVQP